MDDRERCRTQRIVLPLVTAGVLATAYGEHASGVGTALLLFDLALGLVGVAAVPVMLRRPVPVAVVLGCLAALAPPVTPPANVALLLVARTESMPLAVLVALVQVSGHAVGGLRWPVPGLSFGWYLVLAVIVHAGLLGWGALARARALVIDSLRERARRAEAEQGRLVAEARVAERTAIAREMHDVLAHRLSLLTTYAGALEYRPDAPPERLAQGAAVIRATAHQALEELREVITLLRDEDGDDTERPQPALVDVPALVEETRAGGTPVRVRDTVADPAALPGTTGRCAYRVVQEALTNARKHAPGAPVRVDLAGTSGDRLLIAVTNPLSPPGSGVPGTGSGLVGLTERVRLAGGELDHGYAGGEFRLRAWLPWPA
ncbi:histidine kinase [Actinokineospora sp. PR83]|uniref:sensor histidine kinase n=1 Tax=Actinokineospora sp. PR83 TaxID=2884908 RepID=UPI0027DF8D02|nr:histidine kinase [Actinokineospora sp. PR83]MCG8920026.1 histidine kinase [Actinokineospora sp. PR83]